MIGTPEFMAPEIYEENYNHKVDIYSFGMCLLELLTGQIPYNECTVVPQIWKRVNDNIKPESLNNVTNLLAKELILECISSKANDRPTISEIKSNLFFNSNNDDELLTYRTYSINIKEVTTLDTINEKEDI